MKRLSVKAILALVTALAMSAALYGCGTASAATIKNPVVEECAAFHTLDSSAVADTINAISQDTLDAAEQASAAQAEAAPVESNAPVANTPQASNGEGTTLGACPYCPYGSTSCPHGYYAGEGSQTYNCPQHGTDCPYGGHCQQHSGNNSSSSNDQSSLQSYGYGYGHHGSGHHGRHC